MVCRQTGSNRAAGSFKLLALLAGLVAGCQGGGSQGGNWLGGGGSGGHAAGDRETWTIECNSYEGAGHEQLADNMATMLKRVRNLKPELVSVEHDARRSRVLYGQYDLRYVQAKTDNPDGSQARGEVVVEQTPDLKNDLRFIKSLSAGDQYPFFSARAIPRPTRDVGPPEWDLRNAKGVYSLHVGVTYNTPEVHDYKQAAVEWVRVLRADGYEAYYYHDPDEPKSDICVGTFGEDAHVEERPGSHRYSEAVLRLQSQADFRWNLENAHKVTRTQPDGGQLTNQSFLVRIPRDRAAAGSKQ
jgi:hypothetical protein